MSTVTIPLSDERLLKLKELAHEGNVEPESLLREVVEEWLSHPKADFARAAEYVMKKNAELLRRLA